MAQAYACQLALIAFATTALQGLLRGAEFVNAVQSSLLVLMMFYVLGWILGELARRLVEESVQYELNLSSKD